MSNLAYQEDIVTELLNGETVAMSPRPVTNHEIAAANIQYIFKNYLKGKPCMVFGELDVFLTKKDRVIPDVMVVCNRDIIKANGIHGAPDLLVEILSPGTAKKDKGYKKDLYERCGVKEYWIVDTNNRSIEVYLLKDGKYVLDNVYSVFPDYVLEKMSEEEQNDVAYEFKTSLFDDLTIVIEEVFEDML